MKKLGIINMQNCQNIKYNNNTIYRNDKNKSDEMLSLEYLKYLKNVDLNSANSEFVKIIRLLFKNKIDYFRGFVDEEIFEFLDSLAGNADCLPPTPPINFLEIFFLFKSFNASSA